MKHRISLFLLLILLLPIGAPGIQAGPAANANTTFLPSIVVGAPPRPLHVQVNVDHGWAASAPMGAEGGSLTATGADGTLYTLEIPAGAMALPRGEPIEITLSPVAAIQGFPYSQGLAGAVHLAPEGLLFLEPATLTVTPAGGYNLDQLTGFAYAAQGQDFHMYPIHAFTPTSYALKVSHFSGLGGGHATQDDRQQQSSRPPSGEGQRRAQESAQALTDLARQRQDDPHACMELAHQITLDAQLRSWYDGLVWPQLQAAENNEYILRAAIEAYFTWLAHLQALSAAFCRPLEAEYHLEINQALASMDRGLQNALAKAHETCVADRDPYQITHMFAWAAYSLAISQVRDLTQEATSRVDRCLRFELDFESRIWDAEGLSGHVRAQGVPLQTVAPYAVEQYEGEGPLTYVEFVFPYEDCPVSVQTSDAFLEVLLLSIALGEHPPPGGVVAHINPGYTMEVVTFHCEDGSYTLPPTTWWRAGFSVAHMDSLDYGMGGYRVDNWGVLYPGGVFANKVYGPRHVGEGVMEHTTLTLRHTPLP